jgi:adenosylcobyric acid synthase
MSSLIFHINGTNKIIAQAQAVQALGARTVPDVRMNPILLKPMGNYESEVYVYGEFLSKMRAQEYYSSFVLKKGFKLALDAFKSLRKENDLIILEGAGSPAEINIQKYDIANMLLAEKVNAPVLLVADIERGGCFASILGTILLLKPKHRVLIKGLLINKFLGDNHILSPAVKRIESDTKKPVLGIIPKIDHTIPSEDSLDGGVGHTKSSSSSNQDKNKMCCTEGSEIIDKEISKVSKIIESTINVEFILRNLLN